jgi:hypothetical protein
VVAPGEAVLEVEGEASEGAPGCSTRAVGDVQLHGGEAQRGRRGPAAADGGRGQLGGVGEDRVDDRGSRPEAEQPEEDQQPHGWVDDDGGDGRGGDGPDPAAGERVRTGPATDGGDGTVGEQGPGGQQHQREPTRGHPDRGRW